MEFFQLSGQGVGAGVGDFFASFALALVLKFFRGRDFGTSVRYSE